MIRGYVDTSKFRGPYAAPGLMMSGLGSAWPARRQMYDVSNFMAPYDEYYFQDNQLLGLGAAAQVSDAELAAMPDEVRRYLVTGEPMGTLRRDLGAASAQIPRWTWAILMVGGGYMTYRSYQAWKKARAAKPAARGPYTPAERQLKANARRRARR